MPEAGAHLPEAGEPHAALAPVLFLLGRWEGAGVGGYPTIESFQFGQEISFSHNGKPYLIYVSRTWLLDADALPPAEQEQDRGQGGMRLSRLGQVRPGLRHRCAPCGRPAG